MLKKYYKSLAHSPSVIITLLALIVYSIAPFFSRNILKLTIPPTSSTQIIPLFNVNYWSFFSITVVTFFMMPLYAIYSQNNRVFFQKESVIIRFDNSFTYWKYRITYLFTDTVIFIAYIYFLLILRLLFFNETDAIAGNALNMLVCIPLNIIGFMAFGLIFQFVFALTDSTAWSFFLAYVFVIYDFFANRIGWPVFYINRSLNIWPDYSSVNLINLCVMIIALTVIITVSVCFLSKRDCFIPKENKDVT